MSRFLATCVVLAALTGTASGQTINGSANQLNFDIVNNAVSVTGWTSSGAVSGDTQRSVSNQLNGSGSMLVAGNNSATTLNTTLGGLAANATNYVLTFWYRASGAAIGNLTARLLDSAGNVAFTGSIAADPNAAASNTFTRYIASFSNVTPTFTSGQTNRSVNTLSFLFAASSCSNNSNSANCGRFDEIDMAVAPAPAVGSGILSALLGALFVAGWKLRRRELYRT